MSSQLGEFLRARRARVRPEDAGLATGPGLRRTPGLRREELATLAGVSVDYYTRLEQGRERHPGGAVVTALASALRLNEEEHAHLYTLARVAERGTSAPAVRKAEVRTSIRRLLHTVRPCPAYVLSRTSDVLAANPEVLELFTGITDWPAEQRNTVRYTFCHPAARELYDDWEARAADAVANLQTVAAAHPSAPDVVTLITELQRTSPDFARLWQRHDVQRRRSERKPFHHPQAGLITFDFDVLYIEDEQRIGIYQTTPGTADHDAMAELTRLAGEHGI
ncbi:helix-turn-helix transcriptional regulator [Amycolatopsis taiwanensis]|uniref:DNA-binding protein n=1 Tax=Amycolatopsis taiwanensis TaxID=342230 RepID=A0A9W6R8G7_9PSEU|nr:helix-turn-helix transcriptional regulator [Amycolatopsis taiwanensis]GLY70994.1 DNA-binding protein [Amycolatopsis taiwanensis]